MLDCPLVYLCFPKTYAFMLEETCQAPSNASAERQLPSQTGKPRFKRGVRGSRYIL